jgi:hypothetical protein
VSVLALPLLVLPVLVSVSAPSSAPSSPVSPATLLSEVSFEISILEIAKPLLRQDMARANIDVLSPGQLFSYAILGFAFAEATGLFALMVAFLILYAY